MMTIAIDTVVCTVYVSVMLWMFAMAFVCQKLLTYLLIKIQYTVCHSGTDLPRSYWIAGCKHSVKQNSPSRISATTRTNQSYKPYLFQKVNQKASQSINLSVYGWLQCALASCGAVYCNRSCLWVCVFATGGRAGGRVVSEPNYSQRTRSVCISLSAFFIRFSSAVWTRAVLEPCFA